MLNSIYINESGYLNLLKDVIEFGSKKEILNPLTKTPYEDKYLLSLFGVTQKFDISNNKLAAYTTKKVFIRAAIEEMLWFLEGSGDVTKLMNKGVHIWDDWAFNYYKDKLGLPSKDDFVNYVSQNNIPTPIPLHYTNINSGVTKQADWVVSSIKKRPYRKSYLVSYWDPKTTYEQTEESGLESVVIAACHTHHQVVINEEKLSLLVFIRSNDLFLGNPFNVCQYSFLAHLYGHMTGYPATELIVCIGDAHLYSDHLEVVQEQLKNEPYPFPDIALLNKYESMSDYSYSDLAITNYVSHTTLKGALTFVGGIG